VTTVRVVKLSPVACRVTTVDHTTWVLCDHWYFSFKSKSVIVVMV